MSVTSILNEVVEHLEQDPNLNRIKKVMFCACKGKWENNHKKLHNLSVETLVKELYWKTQKIDKLYKIFDKILSKINKKTEYSLVINTILEQVSKLYLEVNEAQKENTEIPWLVNSSQFMLDHHQRISKQQHQESVSALSQDLRILFEVRFKLMQHSNPLRVKILIFSAIEREFNFTSQDWLQLRSISLDQLLQQLVQTFPTLPALESHLKKVSSYLDKSDEMLQVATVIVESIKPLYQNNKSKKFLSEPFESRDNLAVKIHNHTDDIKAELNQLLPVGEPRNHRAVYQSFQHSNLSENETLHLIECDPLKPLSVPELKPSQESGIESELTSSYSESISDFNDSVDQESQDFLEQKIQSEQEIEKQINQSVTFAISQMKTLLKDLEVEVESHVQYQPLAARTETQYKALKKFMRLFQEQVIDFDKTLTQSKKTDYEAIGLVNLSNTPNESNDQSISQPYNQNQMMEFAQQGNCQAITALINQSLNPRGIKTLTKSRNDCLHVFLESEEVPSQESTAQFVHKKLIFLKIKSIQSIKIYGRRSGYKAITWTQEFVYNQA